MTNEQLNAHRDNFERQYAEITGLRPKYLEGKRFGGGYETSVIHMAWQAYQWAIADAAKQPAPIGYVDTAALSLAVSDQNGDCIAFRQHPARGNIAIYTSAAAQQSAQPVAWLVERSAFRASPHGQDAESHEWLEVAYSGDEKGSFPVYAAAQPVEVQQRPLSCATCSQCTRHRVGNVCQLHGRGTSLDSFCNYWSAAHGIKPTSTEGGAS